ncbi:MAG TPA: VanW family protein [Oculatellaceae cyanobacterium]
MMPSKSKQGRIGSYLLVGSLLAATAATNWYQQRFPDILITKLLPTHELTLAQRYNIQQASTRLNGTIIAPHEQFSFNKVVGPRTSARGYLPAPSYIGRATEFTTGGGVCVLSSMVYQIALESGMQIDKRTPHLRTTLTSYPGLDATVWYGKSDLVFTNTTNSPLEIRALTDANSVKIQLAGRRPDIPVCSVHRREIAAGNDVICVDITRTIGTRSELVSHDTYRLSHRQTSSVEN